MLVSQVSCRVQWSLFAKIDSQELHMPNPAHLHPLNLNLELLAWPDVCTDMDSSLHSCLHVLLSFLPPSAQISYLCLEAFYQNGNKKVEEHIIAEGHQGHKVECCPWGCRCHPIVQDHVPVLLSEDLQRGEGEDFLITPLLSCTAAAFKYWLIHFFLPFWPFLSIIISRSHEMRQQHSFI